MPTAMNLHTMSPISTLSPDIPSEPKNLSAVYSTHSITPIPKDFAETTIAGQMSAWYIFSAMGFYPVDPVSGNYIIGAPQMPRITIDTPSGNKFTVIAENISDENKYVESVTLNGLPIDRNFITHEEIISGGELRFSMSPKPASWR